MRLLLKNKADASLVFQTFDKEVLQGVSVDDHEAVIQLLLKELEYPMVKVIRMFPSLEYPDSLF